MDFKSATDRLCQGVSHDDLASALGVSVATIRQARLEPSAKAHRNPPADWARGIKEIAASQLRNLETLLGELEIALKTEPADLQAQSKAAPSTSGGQSRARKAASAVGGL